MDQVRAEWRETIKGDGGICPCCDRWGKIYGRNINKTMAASLQWLANAGKGDEWVDVPNTAPTSVLRSNQLPTLRWWGLVERQASDSPKVKHSGMWRTTTKGREFIAGNIQIPEKVFTYNGDVVGFGTDLTTFKDCLGVAFDYSDVMQTTYN